jgi:ABC-type multidrug transport system ATPase subunit
VDYINNIKKDRSILVTTHNIEEAEILSDASLCNYKMVKLYLRDNQIVLKRIIAMISILQ